MPHPTHCRFTGGRRRLSNAAACVRKHSALGAGSSRVDSDPGLLSQCPSPAAPPPPPAVALLPSELGCQIRPAGPCSRWELSKRAGLGSRIPGPREGPESMGISHCHRLRRNILSAGGGRPSRGRKCQLCGRTCLPLSSPGQPTARFTAGAIKPAAQARALRCCSPAMVSVCLFDFHVY